jgi:hypothetical protein
LISTKASAPLAIASTSRLREKLRDLAHQRRRFGYRRLHILLRRDGIAINRKKTQRLYREEVRHRPRADRCGRRRTPAPAPGFHHGPAGDRADRSTPMACARDSGSSLSLGGSFYAVPERSPLARMTAIARTAGRQDRNLPTLRESA